MAKLQGNSFTPSPVVAPRSGLNPPKNSNKNSSCCRSIGQHMPLQPPAVKPNDAPHKIPKPLVPSLLRRHACLTTPERVKESPLNRHHSGIPRPLAPPQKPNSLVLPLPRPTHAPATTLKTNGNSAPIKPVSFPSSKRVKESPQTKNPSCRHSVAACVSDHSRGQYMLPQRPQSNRKRIPPPPIVIPESPPQGGLAFPPEFRGNSFTPSPAASLGNFVV